WLCMHVDTVLNIGNQILIISFSGPCPTGFYYGGEAGPEATDGNDQRRRTRVAGATGAAAARAPRPRCGNFRAADRAGFRQTAGAAAQEAQAPSARPHHLHRGPAHAGYYRLAS